MLLLKKKRQTKLKKKCLVTPSKLKKVSNLSLTYNNNNHTQIAEPRIEAKISFLLALFGRPKGRMKERKQERKNCVTNAQHRDPSATILLFIHDSKCISPRYTLAYSLATILHNLLSSYALKALFPSLALGMHCIRFMRAYCCA